MQAQIVINIFVPISLIPLFLTQNKHLMLKLFFQDIAYKNVQISNLASVPTKNFKNTPLSPETKSLPVNHATVKPLPTYKLKVFSHGTLLKYIS